MSASRNETFLPSSISSSSSKIVRTAVTQLSPGPNRAKAADSQGVRGGAVGP